MFFHNIRANPTKVIEFSLEMLCWGGYRYYICIVLVKVHSLTHTIQF